MKKLFFLLLAFSAGVLTLAWINSRPDRRPGRRGPTHRPAPGADGSSTGRRAETTPAASAGSAPTASDAAPRRCEATTTSGKRCSRDAEEGSRFCWQHG